MDYIIVIRDTFEHSEHPYPDYEAAFKAYDNFIVLYSNVKGVHISLCKEGFLLQEIAF